MRKELPVSSRYARNDWIHKRRVQLIDRIEELRDEGFVPSFEWVDELLTLEAEIRCAGPVAETVDLAAFVVSCSYEACPEEPEKPKNLRSKHACLDMLGREVLVGDSLWNVAGSNLHSHYKSRARYTSSVICPRPGDGIPEFDGWRAMCEAMQDRGALFQFFIDKNLTAFRTARCNFNAAGVDLYRRSPDCKWKGV